MFFDQEQEHDQTWLSLSGRDWTLVNEPSISETSSEGDAFPLNFSNDDQKKIVNVQDVEQSILPSTRFNGDDLDSIATNTNYSLKTPNDATKNYQLCKFVLICLTLMLLYMLTRCERVQIDLNQDIVKQSLQRKLEQIYDLSETGLKFWNQYRGFPLPMMESIISFLSFHENEKQSNIEINSSALTTVITTVYSYEITTATVDFLSGFVRYIWQMVSEFCSIVSSLHTSVLHKRLPNTLNQPKQIGSTKPGQFIRGKMLNMWNSTSSVILHNIPVECTSFTYRDNSLLGVLKRVQEATMSLLFRSDQSSTKNSAKSAHFQSMSDIIRWFDGMYHQTKECISAVLERI